MDDDDDFDLDGALDASLAQMEANETTTTTTTAQANTVNGSNTAPTHNNNNNNTINIKSNEHLSASARTTDSKSNIGVECKADDAIMQDALNAVQQSISNANDAQNTNDTMNDDEMKDFFNEIFKSFSNLEENDDDESLDKALKKVMTQFFDSQQLKEPVQIICSKYPQWLESNQDKLSLEEYENYQAQHELYRQANVLLSATQPDTSKIMDILLKTFSYGSLPPEVMDGMMPDELKQFADQMAKFEKDVDDAKENNHKNNNSNNNNNRNGKNSNNDNASTTDDDMNADEAMKFFQQLMGMKNGAENTGGDNDFVPNLNDLPKLNEEEMKQFKQLMGTDGCLIM